VVSSIAQNGPGAVRQRLGRSAIPSAEELEYDSADSGGRRLTRKSATTAGRKGDPYRPSSPRAICVPYGTGTGGAWRSLTVTHVTLTCARFSIGAGPHEW
jgi:hypothetical protein